MAKKPAKKMTRYTTTYTLDGATKTITYMRAVNKDHVAEEDAFNQQYAEDYAEYAAACELGLAKGVKVKTEEVYVG